MRVGSKTVCFGVHQPLIHTVFVARAWRLLYSRWPDWREIVCIFIHDLGYWGCETIDGEDGIWHPEFGASIASRIFGEDYGDLVMYHSRTMCEARGKEPSRLCYADKYASALCPQSLYLLLARLSGEIEEYRKNANRMWELTGEGCPASAEDTVWHKNMKKHMETVALNNNIGE